MFYNFKLNLKVNNSFSDECVLPPFSYFLALKEALENMMNESKTLQLAIKTVDANCPDPFEQPESFSLYLAKKADSSFLLEEQDEAALVEGGLELKSELERLKAVKLVEESLHQAEREALAAAMAQLEVLKGELEQVNKQNTAFMTQIQQLKQIQSANEELDQLKAENTQLSAQLSAAQSDLKQLQENYQQTTLSESQTSEESKSIAAELEAKLAELTVSNSQLQSQLTAANSEMESKLVEFMASKFEIEEVNARLSLELKEAQDQLREYEKETVKEKADSLAEPVAEEIDFKYNYLSNVIINYLQRPEQRPQLIGVLATTLQLSPEDINKLKL